jgi:non-reducing end alpha-L-arabinofuranosidase
LAVLGLASSANASTGPRPCDIYAAAGTPCVAAYSTTRALYSTYRGSLYEVRRLSDGRTASVGVTDSGYANSAAQDRFCAHTSCVITVLFDQSPEHNNLKVEGPGSNGRQDRGVSANRDPVEVGGHRVYAMYFQRGDGYRDNSTIGVPRGGAPQSIYMVTSGTHDNAKCCFDFGNAETDGVDNGNGHMDALYFGSDCPHKEPIDPSVCSGSGPWEEADFENGLFASSSVYSQDRDYRGNRNPFVTAMLETDTQSFALQDANAQRGPLATRYDGPLPGSPSLAGASGTPSGGSGTSASFTGYWPLQTEGAIVLGTGGDDSNKAVGTFFEGVVTRGRASAATEDRVQAEIIHAAYRTIS